MVYDRAYELLKNQVLVAGLQYQRIIRLQQHGCEVAISDSPLIQGVMYLQDATYYNELYALLRKLEGTVNTTLNVWVNRVKPYSEFGRMQTEEQAKALDVRARELILPLFTEIDGNRHGVHRLAEEVLKMLRTQKGVNHAPSQAS